MPRKKEQCSTGTGKESREHGSSRKSEKGDTVPSLVTEWSWTGHLSKLSLSLFPDSVRNMLSVYCIFLFLNIVCASSEVTWYVGSKLEGKCLLLFQGDFAFLLSYHSLYTVYEHIKNIRTYS